MNRLIFIVAFLFASLAAAQASVTPQGPTGGASTLVGSGGGGSGTINSGTAPQAAFYSAATTIDSTPKLVFNTNPTFSTSVDMFSAVPQLTLRSNGTTANWSTEIGSASVAVYLACGADTTGGNFGLIGSVCVSGQNGAATALDFVLATRPVSTTFSRIRLKPSGASEFSDSGGSLRLSLDVLHGAWTQIGNLSLTAGADLSLVSSTQIAANAPDMFVDVVDQYDVSAGGQARMTGDTSIIESIVGASVTAEHDGDITIAPLVSRCVGIGEDCNNDGTAEINAADGSHLAIVQFGSASAPQSVIQPNITSGFAYFQIVRMVGTAPVGQSGWGACDVGHAGSKLYWDDTNDGKPAYDVTCASDSSEVYAWTCIAIATSASAACPP